MAVDSVLKVMNGTNSLDLRDIKLISKLGGTVDDSEMIDGMVFDQRAAKVRHGTQACTDSEDEAATQCVRCSGTLHPYM